MADTDYLRSFGPLAFCHCTYQLAHALGFYIEDFVATIGQRVGTTSPSVDHFFVDELNMFTKGQTVECALQGCHGEGNPSVGEHVRPTDDFVAVRWTFR